MHHRPNTIIAATAFADHLTEAARNRADYGYFGLKLYNPFKDKM